MNIIKISVCVLIKIILKYFMELILIAVKFRRITFLIMCLSAYAELKLWPLHEAKFSNEHDSLIVNVGHYILKYTNVKRCLFICLLVLFDWIY